MLCKVGFGKKTFLFLFCGFANFVSTYSIKGDQYLEKQFKLPVLVSLAKNPKLSVPFRQQFLGLLGNLYIER